MDVWLTGQVSNPASENSLDSHLKISPNTFPEHLLYTAPIKKMMNFFMQTTSSFI